MTSEEPLNDRCAAECRDGGYCENRPVTGADRCRMHGGTTPTSEENSNVGGPEGNQKAVTHGAFSKHFRADLSETELEAFEDAREHLDSPEGAQDIGREAATEALLKYKRSGDARFLHRFESLSDTFNLAPEDALDQSFADAMMNDLRRVSEDE